MGDINVVVIAGNLTRDPELKQLAGGNSVCKLRLAVNSRYKDRESGQWMDRPNFFDVTVWGGQGEACARYLKKGSGVIVDGRLEWREWDAQDGTKRQAVEIVAENTRFMGGREGGGGGDFGSGGGSSQEDFAPVASSRSVPAPDEDDIPF